jgi:hypothetical protein
MYIIFTLSQNYNYKKNLITYFTPADKGAACEAVNITDTYGTYNLPFLFNNDFVTEDCVYDDPSEKRKAVFFCEIDPLDKTKAYYTSEYGCFKTANTEKYDELAKNAENEVIKNINFIDKGKFEMIPLAF